MFQLQQKHNHPITGYFVQLLGVPVLLAVCVILLVSFFELAGDFFAGTSHLPVGLDEFSILIPPCVGVWLGFAVCGRFPGAVPAGLFAWVLRSHSCSFRSLEMHAVH